MSIKESFYGKERLPSTVIERPDFGPAQVRGKDELRVGSTYIVRNDEYKSTEQFTVLGEPYQEKDGKWWVKVQKKNEFKMECSLADIGIVPYKNNTWNRVNWLEDPQKLQAPQQSQAPL